MSVKMCKWQCVLVEFSGGLGNRSLQSGVLHVLHTKSLMQSDAEELGLCAWNLAVRNSVLSYHCSKIWSRNLLAQLLLSRKRSQEKDDQCSLRHNQNTVKTQSVILTFLKLILDPTLCEFYFEYHLVAPVSCPAPHVSRRQVERGPPHGLRKFGDVADRTMAGI